MSNSRRDFLRKSFVFGAASLFLPKLIMPCFRNTLKHNQTNFNKVENDVTFYYSTFWNGEIKSIDTLFIYSVKDSSEYIPGLVDLDFQLAAAGNLELV
jgi:hypothetical protein